MNIGGKDTVIRCVADTIKDIIKYIISLIVVAGDRHMGSSC